MGADQWDQTIAFHTRGLFISYLIKSYKLVLPVAMITAMISCRACYLAQYSVALASFTDPTGRERKSCYPGIWHRRTALANGTIALAVVENYQYLLLLSVPYVLHTLTIWIIFITTLLIISSLPALELGTQTGFVLKNLLDRRGAMRRNVSRFYSGSRSQGIYPPD